MAATVLMTGAALFFKFYSVEDIKAEVTLLNNSVLLKELQVQEKNEVFRATVTAKNADIFPRKFYLEMTDEGNYQCELWTAYLDQLLAEGSGEKEVVFNFKEGVVLGKDDPKTWRFFCDLNELANGETIQANLKADPAVLEWESASRQNFREIKLLTDNLVGPEISK